jgi:hypothetical protein
VEPAFLNVFLYQSVQMRLVNGQFSRAEGYDLGFIIVSASNIVPYFRKTSPSNQANIPTTDYRNSQDSDLPVMISPANAGAKCAALTVCRLISETAL